MTTFNSTNSVLSTVGPAATLSTTDANVVITNDGYLISTVDDGLSLTGSGQAYQVFVNGVVASFANVPKAGIAVHGTNFAVISVGTGGAVHGLGNAIYNEGVAYIGNAGSITSSVTAILYTDTADGDFTINNAGLIASSDGKAIFLQGSGTHTIENSGTIMGGTAIDHNAIVSTDTTAVELITNTGTINGYLDLGGGDDVVDTQTGRINGIVNLGDGNDTFHGSAFADTVNGGAGNDTMDGGAGNDSMTGGDGNDRYTVDAAGDVVSETNADLLTGGFDAVLAHISYTLGDNVEALTLLEGAAISGTGNVLANAITGNSNGNILNGGVDALADTLTGGAGNDTYVLGASTNDVVVEALGAAGGIDTITSSVGRDLQLYANVENLTLLGTAAGGKGNALANKIIGSASANLFNGLAGNDTITGGAGADAFIFSTALNAAANKDTITDFNVVDTIRLENTGAGLFNALGLGTLSAAAFAKGAGFVSAHDASDRIVYNTATGDLFYDRDGLGGAAAVKFATLANHAAITNADFFVI